MTKTQQKQVTSLLDQLRSRHGLNYKQIAALCGCTISLWCSMDTYVRGFQNKETYKWDGLSDTFWREKIAELRAGLDRAKMHRIYNGDALIRYFKDKF